MNLIKYFRSGFSVNSSSDHSIVFIPHGEKWEDRLEDTDIFGWEKFRLVSSDLKLRYLASNLYSSIRRKIGDEAAQAVIEVWTGIKFINGTIPGVDHQSQVNFPFDWDGKCADREFFNTFRDYVLRDDIAILGGNDNDLFNSNDDYVNAVDQEVIKGGNWICRKEVGYWILFSRHNGNKVRMSFDGSVKPKNLIKPKTPELIDIKITDYCKAGCKWCYQGSAPQGTHADFEALKDLIDDLAECKVFEVVVGGGEPTEHPQFVDILRYCRSKGIVPNFTTKSIKWLQNDCLVDNIIDSVGSFAFSVNSKKETEDFTNLFESIARGKSWHRIKYSFNYALGTATREEFKDIYKVCLNHAITLNVLGYKNKHRAVSFTPYDNSTWLNDIVETYDSLYPKATERYIRIGIDTLVAKQYEEQLKEKGVSDICYDVNDGKFSMYIDAVRGLVGPSSYGNLEVYFMSSEDNSIRTYFGKY